MDEYISKKQTIDRIASCYCMDCEHSNGILCRACEHQDDMDLIDDIPAADVQPVKCGKWKKKKGYLVCSNCGMTFDTIGYAYEEQEEVFRYCSCCGYRMDGDAE